MAVLYAGDERFVCERWRWLPSVEYPKPNFLERSMPRWSDDVQTLLLISSWCSELFGVHSVCRLCAWYHI